MHFKKIAAAMFFAAATPLSAATVTLDCVMTDLARSGGWIPRAALIKVDTNSKALQLLKPTPDQLNGSIRSAKLARNTSKKMILRWVVTGTRSKSNQITPAFNFRAVVEKPSGQVSVIAKPVGYANDFRAKGNCKLS